MNLGWLWMIPPTQISIIYGSKSNVDRFRSPLSGVSSLAAALQLETNSETNNFWLLCFSSSGSPFERAIQIQALSLCLPIHSSQRAKQTRASKSQPRPLGRAVYLCSVEGCCASGECLSTLKKNTPRLRNNMQSHAHNASAVLALMGRRFFQSPLTLWLDTECMAFHHPSQSKVLTSCCLLWSACPANVQARSKQGGVP